MGSCDMWARSKLQRHKKTSHERVLATQCTRRRRDAQVVCLHLADGQVWVLGFDALQQAFVAIVEELRGAACNAITQYHNNISATQSGVEARRKACVAP